MHLLGNESNSHLPTRQSNDEFRMGINIVRELIAPLDPRLASNKILTFKSCLLSNDSLIVFTCNRRLHQNLL